MNMFLDEADHSSEETRAKIRKNERAASEALVLIVKRHRKLEPLMAFEQVANTIGILSATIVRDMNGIAGVNGSVMIRDLIAHHMDRQIAMITEKEPRQ